MSYDDDTKRILSLHDQNRELRAEIERLADARAYANVALSEENDALIEENKRLRAAHSWQNICLAYQGDTQPCATPCLHCDRISRALEGK